MYKYERNAEIYLKRKAGQTLKSLGEEYGLSRETVRLIAFKEERRRRRAAAAQRPPVEPKT